jgi:hypothetical protein
MVGGKDCTQPYSYSVFNISARGVMAGIDCRSPPRHIVRRISGHEIRLVANLHKFLKPGELLTNPKVHVVYEYYWPLASSHSFDSHPGVNDRIVVEEFPRTGMRA